MELNTPLLICDIKETDLKGEQSNRLYTTSPLQCLNQAVQNLPGIILVYISQESLQRHKDLLELCTVLKSNRLTKAIPIIALMDLKNRTLIESLKDAGVEYVRYETASRPGMEDLKRFPPVSEQDRIENRLKELCPFLQYKPIDSTHEMTVCTAYYGIWALGFRRLHAICENEQYKECPYYKNPKFAE
jgi:PleD family two-component response regulator